MKLEDEKYKEARDLFKRALNQKKDFYNANVSMTFTNNVLQIQREFDEAIVQLDAKNLDDALAIVNDTDQLLKNFHGPAATPIVKQMDVLRNKIKIEQINKRDRKSTRLNSSHVAISYAVFCLKKRKQT